MLSKIENLKRIEESGIVAVVRAENPDQALKIAEAVKDGGIQAIEITMTVPGAIDVIKELIETYSNNEILIGAGSVLDAETARCCILVGAEYKSLSLPITSHIPLEADSPKMNATSSYYTHLQ